MTHTKRRSAVARVLRPMFETILLIGSTVAGLGVIGSCVSEAPLSAGAGGFTLNLIAGTAVAILVVGAVFLLTTMSRDLRRLRAKYVDKDGPMPSPVDAGEATNSLRRHDGTIEEVK